MNRTHDSGPTADPVLVVESLSHTYGDFLALAPCELEIGLGEFVALVGPNGAGKTTLMMTIAGLLEPSAGSVQIHGHPAGSVRARAAVSYIPDNPVLYDDLSLNEHLEYIARMHGVPDWRPRAEALLRRFGLESWADRLPSEFSRGMRQKASIAIGLIRPFLLLVADEPFDGLDPAGRSVLFDLLKEACQAGSTAIVSTHRSDVIETAGRCVALDDGELVYNGPPGSHQLAYVLPEAEQVERE